MRFSLRDLLIAILLLLFGRGIWTALIGRERASASRVLDVVPWLFAFVTYLVVSAFIYSRQRWRPMSYPQCPKCKNSNRFFRFSTVKPAWPKEEITCCNCDAVIELWYNDGLKTVPQSGDPPSFALIWPQS